MEYYNPLTSLWVWTPWIGGSVPRDLPPLCLLSFNLYFASQLLSCIPRHPIYVLFFISLCCFSLNLMHFNSIPPIATTTRTKLSDFLPLIGAYFTRLFWPLILKIWFVVHIRSVTMPFCSLPSTSYNASMNSVDLRHLLMIPVHWVGLVPIYLHLPPFLISCEWPPVRLSAFFQLWLV